MKLIRSVCVSALIFSPSLAYSATLAVKEGITQSQSSWALLATIACAALIGVLLKHVTNTGVHYDARSPLVTERICQANVNNLGRSVDSVRETGEDVKKTVIDHGLTLAAMSEQLKTLTSLIRNGHKR